MYNFWCTENLCCFFFRNLISCEIALQQLYCKKLYTNNIEFNRIVSQVLHLLGLKTEADLEKKPKVYFFYCLCFLVAHTQLGVIIIICYIYIALF